MIGYLVSKYPAVSHTFILREVRALRDLGLDVETATVRRPARGELLSSLDQEEDDRTFAILPASPFRVMTRHLAELSLNPRSYLSTLGLALRLGGGGARGVLWRLFYFAEAMVLLGWCRTRDIRHLHAHFANVAADVALLAVHHGRATGGPSSWSFTMHGPTEFADVERHRLARKVEQAGFVACISDFCRSQLMSLVGQEHWSRLHVVHCGVDPEAFAPPPPRPPAGGPLQVLVLGRLVPEKGQALLIEAVAALARSGRDVRLWIVGDGPDRGRLTETAERLGVADITHFAGAVAQTETVEWYRRADVFCLPSFAEGVPVVLMEAMATELPVVTTRIAGIPELVDDGVAGFLVPPGRADRLAEALEALADDPALREIMGQAGRQRVVEEYDVGRSALRLRRILLEELGGGPGGDAPAPQPVLEGSR